MSAQHVVPLRIYFSIFAALLVLTAVTVGVAFVDLGPMNVVVALAIAALKATLVVLYFMHVRYSSRLTWVVIAASLFWLFLLLAGTMHDYLSRPML
jgi:cytochrome c oxidase subunit IV